MELCITCGKEAKYRHEDRGAKAQAFCQACLPWFLRDRARNGGLTTLDAVMTAAPVMAQPAQVEEVAEEVGTVDVVTEVPPAQVVKKRTKKKVAEPVVEEAVVEAVVETADEATTE